MGRRVPATVPGCVHTDLLAAGLIPDPYLDANELDVAWVGLTDWEYTTTFDWRPDGADRVELVFDGLDTVARIQLNGAELGRTANMHRSYRFDVTGILRPGANELRVWFGSAYTHAVAERERLGPRPSANGNAPFNFVRKMACSFGWDWGPSTVTAGIWRPVTLQSWSGARIDRVRPQGTVEGPDTGRVRVEVDLASTVSIASAAAATGPLTLTARVAETSASVTVAGGSATAVVELRVPGVLRWWPHGHGDAPLYDLTLTLATEDGSTLDTWRRRIGFRNVRLDTTADPDGSGEAFTLVVNDRPLFALGVNWIPDDAFPTRVDRDRYRRRLTQARDAHVNLLRVWGGGLYESDDFYELCDELGLMVWQDFLFACAAYPEEAPFPEEIEAEATEAVTRLMPHPSLVLWNGNNENIWGWFDWNWQEPLAGATWGKGYYLDLLPRVVATVDPTRPYWPGSPYSGSFDRHPNDDSAGPKHVWDVWNQRDYTGYRDYIPRFVAEFGFQAPPTWATLSRAVSDRPLRPDSPGVLHHQKAIDGNGKLDRGLDPHFRPPATMDDWHFLTQVNQARAVSLGIEHFRSHRPRCMGTVWWQLNDCWPVTSWAVVDGDEAPKPAWYALRRAYAPRLLTVQPRGAVDQRDGLAVVLVNDTAHAWSTPVTVFRLGFDGTVLATAELAPPDRPARCPEYDSMILIIPPDLARPDQPDAELLVVRAGSDVVPAGSDVVPAGDRALWWFAEDRDLALPAPDLRAQVRPVAGGYVVTVTARALVRDLCLLADRLDPAARVDEQLVTLLPGETVELRIDSGAIGDPAALLTPPVLRCVNDVVAAPARTP